MFEATTILGYRGEFEGKRFAVIGGDGQVTLGNVVAKANAIKVRTLHDGKILGGFAGSTSDAFCLFEMFEKILANKKGDLIRSVLEFSAEWRKDKHLRRLEAMMIVLDKTNVFTLTGAGDVIEPQDGKLAAIGSGGYYALSAARALDKFASVPPKNVVEESLKIAGEICIYTNSNVKILELA